MMRLTASAAAALFLAGCASFSPDGGFDRVADLTKDRTGQAPQYQRDAAGDVAEFVRQLVNAPRPA